jgi:hypothetical protein
VARRFFEAAGGTILLAKRTSGGSSKVNSDSERFHKGHTERPVIENKCE